MHSTTNQGLHHQLPPCESDHPWRLNWSSSGYKSNPMNNVTAEGHFQSTGPIESKQSTSDNICTRLAWTVHCYNHSLLGACEIGLSPVPRQPFSGPKWLARVHLLLGNPPANNDVRNVGWVPTFTENSENRVLTDIAFLAANFSSRNYCIYVWGILSAYVHKKSSINLFVTSNWPFVWSWKAVLNVISLPKWATSRPTICLRTWHHRQIW